MGYQTFAKYLIITVYARKGMDVGKARPHVLTCPGSAYNWHWRGAAGWLVMCGLVVFVVERAKAGWALFN